MLRKKKTLRLTENHINKNLIRLNKFIANSGYCSRREADLLIGAGAVSVNGQIVTELGYKVSKDDIVKVGNQSLKLEEHKYILLNKPKNVLSTCYDPQGRKTVIDLIKNACHQRLYPVGRLDRNTTGLLILTNDGQLARKIMHPSSKIKKLYTATLDQPLTETDLKTISKGVKIENTFVEIHTIGYVKGKKNVINIELHCGINHIVKRIFNKFGYKVVQLDRPKIEFLTKKNLPCGQWRFLTESEVLKLKNLCH